MDEPSPQLAEVSPGIARGCQSRAASLLKPFRSASGGWRRWLVGLYLAVNGIVLLNAVLHHPGVGYDAYAHLDYVETLATGRMPGPEDTRQFFAAPLPYVFPAVLHAAGFSLGLAAKAGQLAAFPVSLALTYLLVLLGERLRPGSAWSGAMPLLLLAMLPVYYKSSAMLRGEPYVALFTLLAVHLALAASGPERRAGAALALGAVLGLLALSRQWGLTVLPGLALYLAALAWAQPGRRGRLLRAAALATCAALLLAGGFYAHLRLSHGSFLAFNNPRAGIVSALASRPSSFYLGLGGGKLFTDPIRDAYANELPAKLYSETWGDHEAYFLVYGLDRATGRYLSGRDLVRRLAADHGDGLETNRATIGAYLGRVNLLGLVPSVLLVAGLLAGMRRLPRLLVEAASERARLSALLTLVSTSALVAFLWFVLSYPNRGGHTIKATYVLHVLPLLALLGADLALALRGRAPLAFRCVLAFLVVAAVHALPAMVTRYVLLPGIVP